ncbi:hypothetical protein DFH09DRAFT_1072287 [Mycena vulgaris]|nr:hypothetical protein DFH09DRAFT_1072287 [Mycena vulgaris]
MTHRRTKSSGHRRDVTEFSTLRNRAGSIFEFNPPDLQLKRAQSAHFVLKAGDGQARGSTTAKELSGIHTNSKREMSKTNHLETPKAYNGSAFFDGPKNFVRVIHTMDETEQNRPPTRNEAELRNSEPDVIPSTNLGGIQDSEKGRTWTLSQLGSKGFDQVSTARKGIQKSAQMQRVDAVAEAEKRKARGTLAPRTGENPREHAPNHVTGPDDYRSAESDPFNIPMRKAPAAKSRHVDFCGICDLGLRKPKPASGVLSAAPHPARIAQNAAKSNLGGGRRCGQCAGGRVTHVPGAVIEAQFDGGFCFPYAACSSFPRSCPANAFFPQARHRISVLPGADLGVNVTQIILGRDVTEPAESPNSRMFYRNPLETPPQFDRGDSSNYPTLLRRAQRAAFANSVDKLRSRISFRGGFSTRGTPAASGKFAFHLPTKRFGPIDSNAEAITKFREVWLPDFIVVSFTNSFTLDFDLHVTQRLGRSYIVHTVTSLGVPVVRRFKYLAPCCPAESVVKRRDYHRINQLNHGTGSPSPSTPSRSKYRNYGRMNQGKLWWYARRSLYSLKAQPSAHRNYRCIKPEFKPMLHDTVQPTIFTKQVHSHIARLDY